MLRVADDVADGEEALFVQFLHEAQKSQLQASSTSAMCSIKIFQKVAKLRPKRDDVDDRGNSSLAMIHSFYSKLIVTRKMTFHEMDNSSNTLSAGGLLSCLRDFNLIPLLLSKEDVLIIWKLMSLESVKLKDGVISELTLEQFKTLMSKIAVLAYNRDGMRRMILQANTIMPSHEELVEMLARYMKLDDVAEVKRVIDDCGKKRIVERENKNYSKDDVKREMREDIIARRVGKEMIEEDPLSRIANTLAGKVTGLGIDNNNGAKAAKEKQSDEKKGDINFDSSDDEGSGEEIKIAQNSAYTNRILSPSGKLRTLSSLNISSIQEEELLKVDPRLGHKLNRYCASQKVEKLTTDFEVNDCTYIDLGELEPGQKCTLNVIITNGCSQDIQLDLVARGLPKNDTHVLTHPGSFAPGMKRNATVSFIVDNEMKDVLAFIDIFMVPVRILQPFSVSCPVFYRVAGPDLPRFKPLPVLKQSNFAALVQKYCGKSMSQAVSFEKTSAWYTGPNWKQGPNYVDERSLAAGSRFTDEFLQVVVPGCIRGSKTLTPKHNALKSSQSEFSLPVVR